MTMPPMGSGNPFEETSNDTVAARLSVDVPQDAANNLNQLVTNAHELAVNMEAAARAQGNFIEYLRQLPEVMAQSEAAAAQFIGSAAPVINGGGRSGGSWGRNDAARPDFAGTPGDGSNSAAREAAQREALEDLRRNDPRQLANVIAQNDPRTIRRGDDDQIPGGGGGRGGGGGGGNRPGGAPRPGNQPAPSGPGRPPSEDGPSGTEIDWSQRLQTMAGGGTQWLNTVLSQTAAGGRGSGIDLLAAGVSGAQRMSGTLSNQLSSQIESREARARQEAEAQGMDEDETLRHIAAAGAPLRGLSGTVGRAARGLGVAAAGVTAIKGINSAGEWYQGMRAQGAVRGGGGAEGMQYEMGVRMMAMNPFISTEQSRKIMNSALQNGYTGKEFDTVTEFMADNLKKMNMDVAESVKVLQSNVTRGGQSIAQAQQDIESVSSFAQDPNLRMTSGQLRESYSRQMESMTNRIGAPTGQQASDLAMLTSQIGASDPNTVGLGEIIMNSTSNPLMAYAIAPDGYNGHPGGALSAALNQPDGEDKVIQAAIGEIKRIVQNPYYTEMLADPNQAYLAEVSINDELAAVGINLPPGMVGPLIQQVMSGTLDKDVQESKDRVKKEQTGGQPKKKGFWGSIGAALSSAGHAFNYVDHSVTAWGEGAFGSDEKAAEHRKKRDESYNKMRRSNAEETGFSNDRINALLDEYGMDTISVRDDEGHEKKLSKGLMANEDVMKKIVAGDYKLKLPGADEYVPLENIAGQKGELDKKKDGKTTTALVDLTDRASALLQLLPQGDTLNQNQRSSNSGEDGAARNDPPAGSRYDTGGY
ncbi:tape measure protein [Gordonia phage RedWattleHog]|uniref:Tape measure protein n=1 Tax=Gordonia phage Stormageddon TaxID=2656541 RepID=A0A649VR10_9CAUD|nr:tail length tape measure protein [Gordonia phage Stormageddon]QGJ94906.1 tape measure protein [Gordonia phage Stormageddon]QLF83550.1 tape measure protein [Gordonia phage RedWattleHog]